MNDTRDRDEWSESHRKQVKTIYALIVGGVLILSGVAILVWEAMSLDATQAINRLAVTIGGALILIGLVASMPSTFMPVLSYVLKRIPFLNAKNGELVIPTDATMSMPAIEEKEDG